MVEEFLQKLPEIDTRYEDIVPMEQVSSMVSNGGGSVAMQRDDEYRNRIMKSAKISDRTDSLWQATASSMQQPPQRHGRPAPPHQHNQYQHQHQWAPLHHQNHQAAAQRTTGRHTMLGSNHSSQREASVSPRRVALDTTASGSTSGFGFDRVGFRARQQQQQQQQQQQHQQRQWLWLRLKNQERVPPYHRREMDTELEKLAQPGLEVGVPEPRPTESWNGTTLIDQEPPGTAAALASFCERGLMPDSMMDMEHRDHQLHRQQQQQQSHPHNGQYQHVCTASTVIHQPIGGSGPRQGEGEGEGQGQGPPTSAPAAAAPPSSVQPCGLITTARECLHTAASTAAAAATSNPGTRAAAAAAASPPAAIAAADATTTAAATATTAANVAATTAADAAAATAPQSSCLNAAIATAAGHPSSRGA
ncbi:hypothetical protein M5D96_006030 [Drosophila gunungcola]|uniref:Uncharacterized protein n=1 Tax=Drosophila gunungcola TaxID=103775 RepID=A0A9P9YRJ5_9MUSC|nr:hypothetical protein M5D96_006030 [Drosophila gunungcola]